VDERATTDDKSDRKRGRLCGLGVSALVVFGAFAAVPAMAPAAAKPGGSVVSHTAKQSPPIKLGTSGGWGYDLANGYCCGGTLGSLVEIGGVPHILSNWHVFAMDTSPGGNKRVATVGDPIIQPGLIDVGCYASNAQVVATLGPSPSPEESNVDAAVAAVVTGMVDPAGSILEIGGPSSQTVGATLKQAVKKSGRTSRLTRSSVSGLNATVSVAYENECAGAAAFTKTYTRQILIANRGNKFLMGGDSGSLLVEDVATSPRPLGLLFAGSSTIAVANPIDEVLQAVGATMFGAVSATGATEPASAPTPGLARARAAQERNAARLESIPDGVGHAVGLDATGRAVILVLLEQDTPRARAAIPKSLDGVRVGVEVVGRVVAY
jgi:hypothetical protein